MTEQNNPFYSKYEALKRLTLGSSVSNSSIAKPPPSSRTPPVAAQLPTKSVQNLTEKLAAISSQSNDIATHSITENPISAVAPVSHNASRNTLEKEKSSAQVGGCVLRIRNTQRNTPADAARITQPHGGQSPGDRRGNERKPRTFRCSDDEWTMIEEKAKSVGMSPAAYVREAGIHGSVPLKELTAFQAVIETLRLELVRIGTNLNQATHRLNAQGNLPNYLAAFETLRRPLLNILIKVDAALAVEHAEGSHVH